MDFKSILVCGSAFFMIIACSKKDNGEIKPTLGDVTESVYASGVVKAEGQYIVYATVNGNLKKIDVTVGQTISVGQKLFELDEDQANLNTQNAALVYKLSQENNQFAKDRLAEIEMKIQTAKNKLLLDESILKRNKKVKELEYISDVEYERLVLTYKTSKLEYEVAVKQLAQLKAQLKNDESRNNNTLKINQRNQNDFTVKSAFSGQLFDVLVREGAYITPQIPLATIGKANSFLLELEVDENDMVRVILGQKVYVTMDSYKGAVFEAIIDKIYPIMAEQSRTFKIEAHFVKPPAKLYPNLTAEANIVIKTKKNVITIPKNYLIQNKYVLVNKNEKRKVKTGLSDYQKVEILEGLKPDESIFKPE
ncbi:efflux RND transporter periplasmic adaptor subunit [Flavobacterium taihuense]|uniref:Efflux RND transporter periplasmic adaptor subunit n=1 Tax=Flavobacterium taihuense TaxID=2857508 RepID=A0ABS6XXW7_9FLAO|nr:efflux RND transporter periplasmic adaptor subunit [Flavobacterium taihuense]MBW4361520.1 efflux RND transporter periplasmic adaptor subunit [Flavobacterium taihuense]